ncbi:uncharacterized protein Dmoj_GI26006 [Drosophila mojavensis]|uniref:Uncharacterized protein n=1 Tax=Drosophila mojavensis TaxID=7230 RepID=A0A0Q9XFC3_DROMO|nr:uncharacterized protein Dmoj_GI26006 [Drosophila mojavensis]
MHMFFSKREALRTSQNLLGPDWQRFSKARMFAGEKLSANVNIPPTNAGARQSPTLHGIWLRPDPH